MQMTDVIDMLRQMTDLYDQIYGLAQEKRKAVIEDRADDVGEIVKQEWDLLGQASTLEENRIRAVAEALGVSRSEAAEPGSLEKLMEQSSGEEKEQLENAAAELRQVVNNLQTLNSEIQDLIDLHLEYTDYMVNMVFKEPQVSNIYGTSGQVLDDGPESGNLHGIIDTGV